MKPPEDWPEPPPPKPAEPQNQIRKTDWLGLEYPVSTFDPNMPESNDNPRRTSTTFDPPPPHWAYRRRQARAELLVMLGFALGIVTALLFVRFMG